ncbi:sulfotransferase 6B1-like [Haliotis rubra]|uniref:sulfotransferase 6B1-like n=1 Tax=Haliotis rubra TaxID=36100 RepID=UPI001EE58F78|nr:sulfotransferase 6B1-like [Haliotis rubra]
MSQAHLVEVPDDGGDTCTLIKDNGVNLPVFPDGVTIDDVRSVKIRGDDIMLCTYPKSGTHWVHEITRELLTGEITNDDVTMGQTFMECASEVKYANLQSPRLLCSHLLMKHLPEDVLNKKIKIITVLRNPKDVAVSFYNFSKTFPGAKYKGKWENYLQPLFQGKQTVRTLDRPRTWRPRVTTPQEDRYLRTLHLRNRFLTVTSSEAHALGRRISTTTVTRRLRTVGIRAY